MKTETLNIDPNFFNTNESVKSAEKVPNDISKKVVDIEGIMPQKIENIKSAIVEGLEFNEEYVLGAMVYVASVAIGNTHRIKVKNAWEESAAVYIALVGAPGVGKSHPISLLEEPIRKRDDEQYRMYEEEKEKYNQYQKLDKDNKAGADEPPQPVLRKYTISDSTSESRIMLMANNPRGCGLYSDEIMKIITDESRYNRGGGSSEELNTIFNNKRLSVDRKSKDPIYIRSPYLSIIGTIQPSVLNKLASGSRGSNGFMDRILFVYPKNIQKKKISDNHLPDQVRNDWEHIISTLFDLEQHTDDYGQPMPETLRLEADAWELFKNWQHDHTDLHRNTDDEHLQSRYSKLEIYVVRFSLIFQLLQWACGEAEKRFVSASSVKSAIKLAEYFKSISQDIIDLSIYNNSFGKLTSNKQDFYRSLPERFCTRDAVELGARFELSDSTVKKILKNKDLFEKIKHGHYEKTL